MVAWSPVTFLDEQGYYVHRHLCAIDQNTLITKLHPRTHAKKTEVFYTLDQLKAFYESYFFLISQAEQILDACSIEMSTDQRHNRLTFTGSTEGDFDLLNKLTHDGIKARYGEYHGKAYDRMDKELHIIKTQGFCPYFLITWDTIRYAESVGYAHVGRGSGANSIIAYALKITDVDPLKLNLPFERFINEFRSSPPDFDIDFSWDQRDDILDYIFKRYGSEHTAMLATYTRFRGRSIIRELGKVYGLPKTEIDQIVAEPLNLKEHHPIAKTILSYMPFLEDMPNHLSIHAGGVVISEKPLNNHTALQLMPKGVMITHFDMYHAEDMGFHKYDILSQRGLGHIKEAVDLIKENQGRAVDIDDTESIMADPKVKAKLRSAQCMGTFYIESPAMRGLLSKLKCDDYVQLVAASSIIRPGVAGSGMMQEYIKRRHDPYSFEYLHPIFEEELSETYGVMIYQEDVMKIAYRFADLPMEKCDILRRIMSGKKTKGNKFNTLQKEFFQGCKYNGHDDELSKEVWRQMASFAGYSFCKAHSASYAVQSFQSLYLKTYFPLEFMVAVLNNFGGFYGHTPEHYFHEAQMYGAIIHPPCINNSDILTVIKGKDIYVGLCFLRGLEKDLMRRIVENRHNEGPYFSLEDFVVRVNVKPDQLDILIRIGAFRFTGFNKYELMWSKHGALNPKSRFEYSGRLFDIDENKKYTLPNLKEGQYDQAFDEIELLGFCLRSPFDLLVDRSMLNKTIRAKNLRSFKGQLVNIIGHFVCRKNTYTKHHKLMNFGTWLDIDGTFFDTVHFPQILKEYPLRGKGIYLIVGKVVVEFGFPSIEVDKCELVPMVQDERYR